MATRVEAEPTIQVEADPAELLTMPVSPGQNAGPVGINERFGEYRIVRELGRGGMGIVYEALDIKLQSPVAIKMIRRGDHATEEDIQRFLIEARAVAEIHSHANIVKISRIGEELGQHYFVMQLIRGSSLKQRLNAYRDDPKAAVELMIKIADAISHSHQKGLLHRDLKPDNVLVDENGTPYVTDFGLAKRVDPAEADESSTHPVSKTKKVPRDKKVVAPPRDAPGASPAGLESTQTKGGVILGTPSYMPPEQAQGLVKDISTLSDVYGLGAILYAMLCGRAPFLGTSVPHILEQVVLDPPTSPRTLNPKVNADLEAICLMCLEKSPKDRYDSAQALARDLKRWQNNHPVRARPLGKMEQISRWVKNEPLKVGALGLAAAVLAMMGVTGVMEYQKLEETTKTLRAEQKVLAETTKRLQVEQEMKLAESGLREARNAIIGLVDACEPEFGSSATEQALRKKLLNRVRLYFENVVLKKATKDNFGHQLELAGAHLRVADLFQRIGESNETDVVDHYSKGILILEELDGAKDRISGVDPKSVREAAEERGNGYHEYGVWLSQRGRVAEALTFYEKGREVREALCEPCPVDSGKRACGHKGGVDVRTGLARSHGYIGDIHRNKGDDEKAEKSYNRSHDIRQTLWKDHRDKPEHELKLTIQYERSHGNLAWLARHRGDPNEAVRLLKEGLRLLPDVLVKVQPEDSATYRTEAWRDLSDGWSQIAEFYLEAGKPDDAVNATDEAAKAYEELVKASGATARNKVLHASAEGKRAEALFRLGKTADAKASCLHTENLLKEAADVNGDVIHKKTFARIKILSGKIARSEKHPEVAVAAFQVAKVEMEGLKTLAPDNLEFKSDHAEALANLGDRDSLKAAVDEQNQVIEKESKNAHFQERQARYQAMLKAATP